ncbi:MAG: hypothetical protein QOH97_3838 [Actinoplanes sp.]|jgi:hypothetical protein|nr:hypothetical protein [Actinoplanes sp.]
MTETHSTEVLAAVTQASLRAPSVFNTQPWRWRIIGDVAELRADPARQILSTDPEGRLLLLSCGVVLHHARVAAAARGRILAVTLAPQSDDPLLLARFSVASVAAPSAEARRIAAAIDTRRTDRRAFGARQVDPKLLTMLRTTVEAEGAHLHLVGGDQVLMLASATSRAADSERDDPAYREDLERWTHRPATAGDGVPLTTAVRPGGRTVPVRDFAPDGSPPEPGPGTDRGASYVVVYGLDSTTASWLRGGEALSALLLEATVAGLSTEPMSDVVEADWPRQLVREMIAGLGEPYVVVRLGYYEGDEPLPDVPRRDPGDVIEVVQP